MRPLTPRQERVLRILNNFQDRHGYAPSVRELARRMGIRSPFGIQRHLEALEKKGFIRRTPRGAVILQEHRGPGNIIPILGAVPAGFPTLSDEHVEEKIVLDESLARDKNCFLLRVRGDSMKEAGILHGDLVLVRPQAMARPGEIVVAMVDGEATVKFFDQARGKILLKPANPDYRTIEVDETHEVRIVGKVLSVLRRNVS